MNTQRTIDAGMTESRDSVTTLQALLDDRYSCRAFLSAQVPDEIIQRMFSIAQRTPSWCNTQPWQVDLLSGERIARFAESLTNYAQTHVERSDLPAPGGYLGNYATRRRDAGYALYASLDIDRADKARRTAQLLENFRFFGAPHTAIITTDRTIGVYGAVDCGAYVSTLLLAAQALGVASIPQAAIAMYSDHVRSFLTLPDDRLVVCAVSFGYPDVDHPVNNFRTSRAQLDAVVRTD